MGKNKEYSRKKTPVFPPPPAPLPEPEEIDYAAVLRGCADGTWDLVTVLGPTASGKTRLAVQLARLCPELGLPEAEILSADSRQVYKGMDIGTGKDLSEYGEIRHHLIDIVPAGSRFDLFQWQQAFEEAYKDIRDRGNIPILCGGTGLYIQAGTCGYALPQVPPNEELREQLFQLSNEELLQKLSEFGPLPDEGVLQSKRRMVRAIEVAMREKEQPVKRSSFLPKNPYFIGTLVSREERIARIDKRLAERLENGLVEEVNGLLDSGIPAEDLVYYGLEYKYVTQYALGILTKEEMITLLSNAIHQFAKRQMTWFRGMEKDGIRIHWTNV